MTTDTSAPENITELDAKTLKSYIAKAKASKKKAADKAQDYYRAVKGGDEKEIETAYSSAKKNARVSAKRTLGIGDAKYKLKSKGVAEEFEDLPSDELNELNKETLIVYRKKAADSHFNAVERRGNLGDKSTPRAQALLKKIQKRRKGYQAATMNLSKSAYEETERNTENSLSEEDYDRARDAKFSDDAPEYRYKKTRKPHLRRTPQSSGSGSHAVHVDGKKWKSFSSAKHATNVALKLQAKDKNKKFSIHKEETELSELDNTTLKSYVKKAKTEETKTGYK